MRYAEKCGTAGQATYDNITRRMRFASWITKATNTHTAHVILIAFPRQQWLRERTSMLRHTYIPSLVHYMEVVALIAMEHQMSHV
jgi:hypothetical protein